MAKIVRALLGSEVINADYGISLRDTARMTRKKDPDFRCTECQHPVRVHRAGGHTPAHFEHLERNEECSLSHKI